METLGAALREWWHVGLFLVGGAFAAMMGRERNTWRISEVGRKVDDIEGRVRKLEAQGAAEAITLAEIKITLANITTLLSELKHDLQGKQDK